jgi:WD40-like Beta Propeller Repeat
VSHTAIASHLDETGTAGGRADEPSPCHGRRGIAMSRLAACLRRAPLVMLCAFTGALALAGVAQAHVFHHYESQITEIPAVGPHGTGVPVPGPVRSPKVMTVDSAGDLYVEEHLDGKVEGTNSRTDQFAPSGATPVTYELVTQLPQPAILPEQYLGGEDGFTVVDDSTSPGDWAKGDVFVVEGERVRVFEPEAGSKKPSKVEVAQITGTSPTDPFGEHLGGIAVSGFNGDVLVEREGEGGKVYLFEPGKTVGEYAFKGQLVPPGGSFGLPVGGFSVGLAADPLAVDGGNGEIYVSTSVGVDEFGPEGAFRGRITGEETPEREWVPVAAEGRNVQAIAVDPVSHRVFVAPSDSNEGLGAVDVFGPDVVVPDVETTPVSNVHTEPATHTWHVQLNGEVKLDKEGQATCQFVWGTSEQLGHTVGCSHEVTAEESPAEAQIGGLSPDTTYFYRLQATNKNGKNPGEALQDERFTTPGPGLAGESISEVSSSSARLEATVDPHGAPTSYYFQYGPTTEYGGEAPVSPGSSIGSGSEDAEAEQNVEGLLAGTTYHYRVVAVSEIEPGVLEEFDGPDQTFITQAPGSPLALPDGRAWELVSPVDKHGALVQPIGEAGLAQAAANGGALTYQTGSPTEADPQGSAGEVQVLSSRGAAGWSSMDIALSHRAATGVHAGEPAEYDFFSEDLGLGIARQEGAFSPQEDEGVAETFPEATEQTPYLRHDSTCESAPKTCYEPIVTSAAEGGDVPEGTAFGGGVSFVGATPDASHVVLSSSVALTSAPGLYEWSAGKPASESLELVAGEGALFGSAGSGRHAISDDGSRIFYSVQVGGHISTEHLYMRDMTKGETVELDLTEGGLAPTQDPAQFQTASANGSRAFFTDAEPLTKSSGHIGQFGDLYECDIEEAGGKLECKLGDLTPVPANGQPGAGEAAGVQGGVLGASEDGSYVYFVASGVQAAGATPGADNLYVAHELEGAWSTSFVASLSTDDSPDWDKQVSFMTARVSPNGEWLAFMSDRPLTGYDNRDAASGEPDEEVYLYDAGSGSRPPKLVCASCDPTGARPHGVEYNHLEGESGEGGLVATDGRHWRGDQWLAANVPAGTPYITGEALYQSRALSDSGRLFFNSSDALVPQDINGNEDVYEYEPPGVGSCTTSAVTFSERANGCIGLISSGVAHGESAFLDASESGGDVFFMTTERLVPQDVDTSLDVYDAHECTSASPCSPAPAAPPAECVSAAACRAAPTPQPSIYGVPSSATFSGQGNLTSEPAAPTPKKSTPNRPAKCKKKGFIRKHGKCVRAKAKKKAANARKATHKSRTK